MKYIVSVLLLCIGVNMATAQEVYTSSGRSANAKKKQNKHRGFDPSKVIVGGGATFGFGSVPGGSIVDLGISPFVGYHFTKHFTAGIGVGYNYFSTVQYLYNSNIGDYQAYPARASIISPNAWTRVFIWNHLFASGIFEYDLMHYSQYNYDNNSNITSEKYNLRVPCLLIGPGYQSDVFGRFSASIEVLYDVLQNPNSQYYGTIVPRITLFVGL
jgi:hypothetical protein